MIAIDQMKRGSPPAGFTFARTGWGEDGEWRVVEDKTATAGQAIEQTSTDRTDYRFPLAIRDSFSAADVEVEIRFKAVDGRIDQAAGIAVRLADPDNYHVARANAMEEQVARVIGAASVAGLDMVQVEAGLPRPWAVRTGRV